MEDLAYIDFDVLDSTIDWSEAYLGAVDDICQSPEINSPTQTSQLDRLDALLADAESMLEFNALQQLVSQIGDTCCNPTMQAALAAHSWQQDHLHLPGDHHDDDHEDNEHSNVTAKKERATNASMKRQNLGKIAVQQALKMWQKRFRS
jgi:hypothetical protein